MLGLPHSLELKIFHLIITVYRWVNTMSTHLKNNKVPHEPGLKEADSNERVEPDEPGVVVALGRVELLVGGLGQSKPEGQDREDD